jgi:serine protease Do
MEKIKEYLLSFKKRTNGNPLRSRPEARIILLSAGSALVVFLIIFGIVYANRSSVFSWFAREYVSDSEHQTQGNSSDANALHPELFSQDALITSAVKKTNPAVVAITITKEVPKYETIYDQQPNFFDPFGGLFPNLQIPQQRQNGTEKKEVGGGSGFLVSASGYIVTNRHVVEDKTAEYTVFLNDGTKKSAKVVARDSVLDIAVIKIEPELGKSYPYLTLGNSSDIDLGQSVIAIGNALGQFKNTVSVGVVSGLSRSITAGGNQGESEQLDNIIQTDAAINPGNSGGPLLDLRGEVIGVNVAVAQGSQSIGFALPIDSVRSVIESVKATGKIVRPYLGVRYVAVTPELKDKNNLTVDYGDLVKGGTSASELPVIPGSPADKAGIVENDIILEVDGKKLDDTTSLSTYIRGRNVGDTVTLKILHRGTEKTVQIKLEAAPQS